MSGTHITRRGVLLGGLAIAGGTVYAGVAGRPGEAAAGETTSAPAPSIIGCAGWTARPNRSTIPIHDQRPVRILVHHTATPNVTDTSRRAAEALAHSIQNIHMDQRGWLDSGQHFTISRGGFVLEGRHRSLEMLRDGRRQVEGAHCTGQNVVAVGIENEGTYTATGPTDKQWTRLREMCAYICRQYRIRPTELFGHRDFKDTACPGDVLYGMLPQLRTDVARLLGLRVGGAAVAKESWPLLRVADRGPEVLAAQHLLRAAGVAGVVADGRFDRRTADAVRTFQVVHRTEEVNGMIGGESWPLLVAPPASAAEGERDGGTEISRETARAVAALSTSGRTPAQLAPEDWLHLLNRESLRKGG